MSPRNSKYEYALFFDGASRGNPGHSGYGYAIYNITYDENDTTFSTPIINLKSKPISINNGYLGTKTNNEAEYYGLLYGLTQLNTLGINKAIVYGDSTLVINQMNGTYKVKADNLKELYNQCIKLITNNNTNININNNIIFKNIKFVHILRQNNKIADTQANIAIDNWKLTNTNNKIITFTQTNQ